MILTDINEKVIIEAAKKYDTPFFLYEKECIEKWMCSLKNSIPKKAKIMYSLKANPNVFIIKYFESQGLLFETASDGELRILIKTGVAPEKIWISGQGKKLSYLENALNYGVSRFNIESCRELELLSSLVSTGNIRCNIRVNPDFTNKQSGVKMGGVASPFGVDESQLVQILKNDTAKIINGLFMYAGSQYFSHVDIIRNTGYVLNMAEKLFCETGIKLKTIDFGGGFGVPESIKNNEINMESLHDELELLFDSKLKQECFSAVDDFIFESGRYLTARTANFITSIVDIKRSKNENFAITDGGINYLGIKQKEYRIYDPFIKHIPMRPANKVSSAVYRIFGNTCTPIDLTHSGLELESPEIGDLLCVQDCGAYAYTFSPVNFCGMPNPIELLHDNGEYILCANKCQ